MAAEAGERGMTSDRRGHFLLLLALTNLLSYADRSVLAVLVEPIKTELRISDGQIGLLTGLAFAVLYGFVALPVARLADRRARKPILIAGILLWSVATSLSGFAQGFAQLLLCRIGVGAGEAGNSPTSHSIIADSFPANRTAAAFAIFAAGSTFGMSLGLVGGGLLAQHYGWRVTFVAAGVPGFFLALLLLFTTREPVRHRVTTRSGAAEKTSAGAPRLIANRSFIYLTLAYSLWIFLTYATLQWLPSLLIRKFGMAVGTTGMLFGLAFGFGSAFGTLAGGVLSSRVGWLRNRLLALPLFSAASYCFYLAALFCPGQGLTIGILSVASVLTTLGVGPIFAALQSVIPPQRRATGAAVYGLASSLLGIGGAPLVIGLASDALSPSYGSATGLQLAIALAMFAAIPLLFCLARANMTLGRDQSVARGDLS